MKSIFTILGSLLFAASAPLSADAKKMETAPIVQQEGRYRLGTDAVQALRVQYQAGDFNSFLADMDKAYKKAKEQDELQGLIELRKASGEYTVSLEDLRLGFEKIQKEKNEKLLKAVTEQKDSLLGKKVRSATTALPESVKEAAAQLNEYRQMGPGMGKSADENQIIEIDLETQFKEIHLDSLIASGEPIANARELHLVLEMQQMDRMLQASKNFEDKALKSTVEAASADIDLCLAKAFDSMDLNDLARGRVKPASTAEERIASIVADAHAQFSDLNRDLLTQTSK